SSAATRNCTSSSRIGSSRQRAVGSLGQTKGRRLSARRKLTRCASTGGLSSVPNCLVPTMFPRDKCADKRGAQDKAREADGGVVVDGFGFAFELDGEPAQISGGGLRFGGRSAVGLRCTFNILGRWLVVVCGKLGQHLFV